MTRCVLVVLLTAAAAWAEDAASVRVEILVSDAEKLYRGKRPKQAVAKYDQASALAFTEGASGRAFELSRTAAAILQSVGEEAEAGQRLRRLAIANGTHPDAGATHRAAIACLAKSADADPQSYEEALREHIDNWPDAKSTPAIEGRLISWLASQRRWAELLPMLESVAVDDPRFPDAAGLYADAVIGVRRQGDAAELLRRATGQLQPSITGDDNRWPDEWTPHQRAAALGLARIHLAYGDAGPQYPYRLLAAAVSGRPASDAQWRSVAVPLLVEAAVAAGHPEQAAAAAADLPADNSPALRRLVGFLEARLRESSADESAAKLLLTATRDASRDDAPGWLRRGRAAALAASGEHEAAQELLASLDEESRAGPDYDRLSALALAGKTDADSRRRAVRLWRRVESRQQPGSQGWHEARLARIELLAQLGRRDEARKLLSLTAALYPPPKLAAQAELRTRLQRELGQGAKK
ncbi:hypothetical protein [Posidoniimonas corsicana]|uniref:hypothetical protein n=1 Tax=Posidoniimonas corsicana TaxID=1938618 RepID=UPI0018D4412F|nr:hypothetical protein [Posidoniimonas corsicana]